MSRHASYLPHGVIPAILLPFNDDLSIDERAFRAHIRDVAATEGISALTINAHSTEVASCTFDEQRRVLDVAQDEIGDRLPLVHGIWADGSLAAAPGQCALDALGMAVLLAGARLQRAALGLGQRDRGPSGAPVPRRARQRSRRGEADQRSHRSAGAGLLRRSRGGYAQPHEGGA